VKVWNVCWMRTDQRKELENNVTNFRFPPKAGGFLILEYARHSELFRSLLSRRSGFVVFPGAGVSDCG
jgi:hypothetical protein